MIDIEQVSKPKLKIATFSHNGKVKIPKLLPSMHDLISEQSDMWKSEASVDLSAEQSISSGNTSRKMSAVSMHSSSMHLAPPLRLTPEDSAASLPSVDLSEHDDGPL